jgi:sirohydrochlorin cobaltochelatase
MLLAHGTREKEASKPVHEYAAALAQATGYVVEPCLREFIEPSVPTVTLKLVERGFSRVIVLPFFLFKSGHVSRDIVNDLSAQKERYPNVQFVVADPIGFEPAIVNILRKRLETVE